MPRLSLYKPEKGNDYDFLDKTIAEDEFFKLDLDAFMRLIENKKTQERIKHTLATGKPLVN